MLVAMALADDSDVVVPPFPRPSEKASATALPSGLTATAVALATTGMWGEPMT